MKSMMRWRHYCDYCKKSTGTKPAMVKHEKGCTLNPERVCSMCTRMGEVQLTIEQLTEAYLKGFKTLREACHDCPACILATDRQFHHGRDFDDCLGWDHPANTERGEWEFKAACKQFWVDYSERSDNYREVF